MNPDWKIAPFFIVDDIATTANFYRDRLGFHYDHLFGDPPTFCMVKRNGIIIMMCKGPQPGAMRPNQAIDPAEDRPWDAYVWVDDADALYAEFKEKGVMIVREPADAPYGNRDFDVEDCN